MDKSEFFLSALAGIFLVFLIVAVTWFSVFVIEDVFAFPYSSYYSNYNYHNYFDYYSFYSYESVYNYLDYITPTWYEHYTPAWHYSGSSQSYDYFYDDYNGVDFYKEQQIYVYDNYEWSFYP